MRLRSKRRKQRDTEKRSGEVRRKGILGEEKKFLLL